MVWGIVFSRQSILVFFFLFLDKEDMEEVWRQSWVTLDVEVKISQNTPLGLTLKEVSTCIPAV